MRRQPVVVLLVGGVPGCNVEGGKKIELTVTLTVPRWPVRYVRRIVRLAFVSPRIITAIMDGTAPAGLTATALVGKLSYSWAEQEQSLSTRR
jgi:hypothetical protein